MKKLKSYLNARIKKAGTRIDLLSVTSTFPEYDQETVEYWAGYRDALYEVQFKLKDLK